MTFRPSHLAAKDPVNSNEDHGSSARPVRGQQSAWGLPAPRRGLTPLSTNLNSPLESGAARNTTSSASPFAASFSSVLNPSSSSHDESGRGGQSSNSSRNFFSSGQSGSQQGQAGQLLLSPRSRAITPSSNSHSASSAAASTTASQIGGGGSGGGGGGSRNLTFSPPPVTSPTNNSFDRSPFGGSNPSSATSSQSSVSKIVTTQIFLLLNSITEKEGKAKWESQAEGIRRLVESNGMENFPKYFRRLVQGNSPQVFPGSTRNVENPANYPMLVQEMDKITQDPGQAPRIAESLDTTDGDTFRDFDLVTFMNHFKLNSYAKVLLLSAITRVNRQDLKAKAGMVLSSTFDELLSDLANAHNNDPDVDPSLLATCALKYFQDVPEALKSRNDVSKLQYALDLRYKKQRVDLPSEVQSAMVLLELLDSENALVSQICHRGPQITISADAARSFITQLSDDALAEKQISRALLFMMLTPDWREYDIGLLIPAIQSRASSQRVHWQEVIRGLDYKSAEITKEKFLVLFNAFLPLAKEDSDVDVQGLWGGRWANLKTQLSYLRAFLSCSRVDLDPLSIPRFRRAYDPLESVDGPRDFSAEADKALHDTMISLDAVAGVIDILVPANDPPSEPNTVYLTQMIADRAGLFLCSLTGIPTPWTFGQENLMKSLFRNFLNNNTQEHGFILHTLWRQDKHWVAMCLMATHLEDPLDLMLILHVAQEMQWMDDLLTLVNGFGIDLAALSLRKGVIDVDQWLKDKTLDGPNGLINAISKFLVLKAQDELRTSREEQHQPRTVSLSMKTVYDMLALLDDHMTDRSELKALQRQCLQAYPRLIIYCEGITENVDVECTESNNLPRTADAEMQDLYKRMYNGELTVQNILEYLQECKTSEDPAKVDLFACMIHGLFDEFSCFSEYPLGPLATTAVLFGGLMQVRLISDLTLKVGQEMVLDSVRDYPPGEKMYKFGLQALIHVVDRFQEPEWIDYCAKLIKIPGLRGTEAYSAAARAVSLSRSGDDANGVNGLDEDIDFQNGEVDGILANPLLRFKSVQIEPSVAAEEPDESLQEKIVFFFNNVTEQNLKSKISPVEAALNNGYQQWFAHSLVEGRAKLEPNNQPLYMAILELLGNKALWNEVLRETYISTQKLLNAESTLQSTTDRKFLKNLSVWLGSLTLARDKPIKHKNIAFLDLLVEGFSTQKLILVIPFTCNVIAQGARSRIFKPPNPWVVEIIAALMELYREADIKLNQKFEIEVLLKEFGLNVDSIQPSMNYRERRAQEEDLGGALMTDGIENFDDLSLGPMNRGRNSRFDTESMASTLPDLGTILNFPPPTGSVANQTRLRQIVQEAVRRAIIEIVAPVVERSVTIATIATTALIHKDFGTEGDEERIRRAAQQMVRQLSGSLALVTCKEPLKMSMTNYIRMAQNDLPEQTVPEGAILMCVNDNLDIACSIVEQQAEERSMPEIDAHIENELALRRRHRAEHPNEPYVSDTYSRWSSFIPEPYKQTPGGLNPEQMAIYLDFARQSRGPASHAQSSSADSGRQLPDVLQDAFSTMPNVHSTGENMTLSHQTSQQPQHHLQGRMLPPPLPNSIRQPQANGYVDIAAYDDRVQELMTEIRRVIQEGSDESPADQQRNDAVFDLLNQIWDTIERAPETVAMNCAESICKTLYGESMLRQEIEIFVRLLSKLYETYPAIRTEVTEWARGQEDERFLTVDVTVPLIRYDIVQAKVVDAAMTRLILYRGEVVIEYISELLDALVLTKRPLALRADFASTMCALSQYQAENVSSPSTGALIQRLKDWRVEESSEGTPEEKARVREYLQKYIFSEWTRLCESHPGIPFEKHSSAFVSQLMSRQIIGSQEETASFLRICIDGIVDRHDKLDAAAKEIPSKAFNEADSLARLIVMLVKCQSEVNGIIQGTRASVMDSFLSLITLIMNNHAVNRAERFDQRIFFRLWSSILCDWHEFGREGFVEDGEMLLTFATNLLAVNPLYFPIFAFSWLTLISHRFFMPGLLRLSSDKGHDMYSKLLATALSYMGPFLKRGSSQTLAADLYRAMLRIILIIHHDFPEFLVENHFRLCNSIPPQCTQLVNLVLSAYPSSFPELPNPFVTGLKVDRIEEMRRSPRMASEYLNILRAANLIDLLDGALKSTNVSSDVSTRLNEAVHYSDGNSTSVDFPCIHAIVLYIGESAISANGQRMSQSFNPNSPDAALLHRIAKDFSPTARPVFVHALVNQLRYPNTHTHYFCNAILHLFTTSDSAEQPGSDVSTLITTTLIERLHVVKPHPWGIVSTMLELLKNPDYAFWSQSFVKDLPAVGALLGKPLLKSYWD